MSATAAAPIEIDPEFDLFFYLELSSQTRLENDLLGRLEQSWNRWRPMLRAYSLPSPAGQDKARLLLFLDQAVEEEVEGLWQTSPSEAFAFHNLAIAMVMGAARQLVPELAMGGCAPLPRPDRETRKTFKKLGLVWSEEGAVNRSYAVFTPMPYIGGCEICHMKSTCPKSAFRD